VPARSLVCCRSDNGAGDFADAFRTVIVRHKAYLIDASAI
jgi:hypothetical protein